MEAVQGYARRANRRDKVKAEVAYTVDGLFTQFAFWVAIIAVTVRLLIPCENTSKQEQRKTEDVLVYTQLSTNYRTRRFCKGRPWFAALPGNSASLSPQ